MFEEAIVRAVDVSTQATVGNPSVTPKTSITPSLTSTASASPDDEKVKEIRDAVREKVQEKIQEIKDKIEKKGYVGILTEMTDSTLSVDTQTGEKLVTIDDQATIIGTTKKEIKSKDLEIGQKIIAMGLLGENEILLAKRIVVVTPEKNPTIKTAFMGKISLIDIKLKTISLDHLRKLSLKYQLKIDSKLTKFTSKEFKTLKEGDLLVVVSSQEKESETPTALLVNPLP